DVLTRLLAGLWSKQKRDQGADSRASHKEQELITTTAFSHAQAPSMIWRNISMEMLPYRLCLRSCQDFFKLFDRGAFDFGQRPEVSEQFLRRPGSDTGNPGQLGAEMTAAAAFAVEVDGEAMAFIPDLLNQSKDRRAAFQHDRFVFASSHVDD